jgi:hypothetical protein
LAAPQLGVDQTAAAELLRRAVRAAMGECLAYESNDFGLNRWQRYNRERASYVSVLAITTGRSYVHLSDEVKRRAKGRLAAAAAGMDADAGEASALASPSLDVSNELAWPEALVLRFLAEHANEAVARQHSPRLELAELAQLLAERMSLSTLRKALDRLEELKLVAVRTRDGQVDCTARRSAFVALGLHEDERPHLDTQINSLGDLVASFAKGRADPLRRAGRTGDLAARLAVERSEVDAFVAALSIATGRPEAMICQEFADALGRASAPGPTK